MPARGFKHSPDAIARMRLSQRGWRPPADVRFSCAVEHDTNGGCWLWTGSLIKGTGYGQMSVAGRAVGSHRFSYELHHGPIPTGLHVLHRCDVRACVNPGHLFLGTHQDNMTDMAGKGRARAHVGDDHPGKKISASDIPSILSRLSLGEGCRTIALDYGVTACAINAIRRGKSWTHITGFPKAQPVAAFGAERGVTFNDGDPGTGAGQLASAGVAA